MTNIEKKALALVNEVRMERDEPPLDRLSKGFFASQEALCRAIEQHEAYKREVSDAVEVAKAEIAGRLCGYQMKQLDRFIIAKPDPLVEAWSAAFPEDTGVPGMMDKLRAALAARGGRIVWEGETQATIEAEPQEIKLSSFERKFL